MSFSNDMRIGEEYEHKLMDYLLRRGFKVMQTHGVNKEFDVCTYDNNTIFHTYEVKFDRLHEKTGNLAIEYWDRGKWSGIKATKAEYWVHCTEKMMYILTLSEFKEWLNLNRKYLNIKNGGDNNEAKMILIKPTNIVNNAWCETVEI